MKNKETRLYNVIFPLWMLLIFPQTWLVAAPANFIIDFAVLYFTMKKLGVEQPKEKTKKVIIKVWLCGFAADIVGGLLMFLSGSGTGNTQFYKMVSRAMYNPFKNIYAFGWTTMCVAIAAVIIYLLNFHFCLDKRQLEKAHTKKVSVAMAVITAPYLFLLPTTWFY